MSDDAAQLRSFNSLLIVSIKMSSSVTAKGLESPMSGAAQESLGRRLFRSAGWITVGNTSSRILSLISAIIAARLLSQPEFGTFGLIQSTLSTFGVLATM